MVERLVRRKSIVNAVGGVIGTGIAAFIAHRTGRAEAFFVPRMLIQLGYGVVFLGSVAIRRPVTGFIIAALYRAEPGWWKLPPVRRTMSELTLAWAALFFLRGIIYAVLIYLAKPGGLAAASLGLGWPAFGLLMFASYRYVPRRLKQLGAPDPRHGSSSTSRLLERAVHVGPVALQRAHTRAPAGRDQGARTHPHLQAVRGQHLERTLGDPHLPERGRVHVVGHHEVARAEGPQVEHERALGGLDDGVGLLDGAPGARAPEVERDRHHEYALAARGQRGMGARVVGGEGLAVPVGRADVVDAGVQAAEVIARRPPGLRSCSAASCAPATWETRAPSTAKVVNGSPSPRATHKAHDCSATPHWSSPPPLVIESPRARTPKRHAVKPDRPRGA